MRFFAFWGLMGLLAGSVWAGPALDIRKLPFVDEVNLVAIDIKVNPTNMPNDALWDNPILLVYTQVDDLDAVDVDVLREDVTARFRAGQYQPVVIRTRQGQSLTVHLKNAIGMGDAPSRVVEGETCKNCKKKMYSFSYGQNADESQFPFFASIHAHGVAYTIENDGTNAGMNTANNPALNGLIAPGESRSYHYKELDYPGVWPLHDHANPSYTVPRGLHAALVVEPTKEKVAPDHDFLIIFSDYPDYEDYIDERFAGTLVPPFLHMRNTNVMHAHALNGYAAMMRPRMAKSRAAGGTRWDAMRTDLIGDPETPVYETVMGDLVRFRLLSLGGATATHSFHLHAHVWWDESRGQYIDSVSVPSGEWRSLMFYAGGPPYREKPSLPFKDGEVPERSGSGDWLYHCHITTHVKHGMWGIFRVLPKPGAD